MRILMLVALLAIGSPASGQPTQLTNEPLNKVVRISGVLVDTVTLLTEDGLYLANNGHFPFSIMNSLEIRMGTKTRWLEGATIGAGAGMLFGAIWAVYYEDGCNTLDAFDPRWDDQERACMIPTLSRAFASVLVGTLTGGIVGASITKGIWITVRL